MSQRTHAHTTGAAARPTSRRVEPADSAPHSASQPPSEDVEAIEVPATPRRGKRAAAPSAAAHAAPSAASPDEQVADLPLHPDALARALRAVATELERDPALAQRVAQAINQTPTTPSVSARAAEPTEPTEPARQSEAPAEPAHATIGRSFHPTIVTGIAETLGPGVPDPFALRKRLGESGLREALATLRLGSLRAIIRQHGMDQAGNLGKLNDPEKLRSHILAATRKGKN